MLLNFVGKSKEMNVPNQSAAELPLFRLDLRLVDEDFAMDLNSLDAVNGPWDLPPAA